MKSPFQKLIFCLIPVAIATWAVWDASPYGPQRFFRFKLGVDLSGGHILVYELDMNKLEMKRTDEGKDVTAAKASDYYQIKSSQLASSLKNRIDPTGTFSIVIRPAGTEGRVEIIIPTGDPQKVAKAEQAWQELLGILKVEYHIKDLDLPRGRLEELVDLIQQKRSRELWEKTLFAGTKVEIIQDGKKQTIIKNEAWDRLMAKLKYDKKTNPTGIAALDDMATPEPKKAAAIAAQALTPQDAMLQLLNPATTFRTYFNELQAVRAGDLDGLIDVLAEALDEPSRTKLEADIRQYAWEELIAQLVRWDKLQDAVKKDIEGKDSAEKEKNFKQAMTFLEEDLKTVPADSYAELVGRVYSKGNLLAQAGLDSLRILVGDVPDVGILSRQEIEKFISSKYGPSAKGIEDRINTAVLPEKMALIRDPSLEDVQRVKDLVSKVGALEFKMLANQKDDAKAEDEIEKMINSNDPAIQKKLEDAAINGLPPPVVTVPGKPNEPKMYDVVLAKGAKSKLTYGWVELGKQERKVLGFSNDSRIDAKENGYKREIWLFMQSHNNQAVKVPVPRKEGKFLWEGALFLRRECKDRNLPEKERRDKKYEYFVLARNAEYDDTGKQTEAITGDLLRSASAEVRDGRPSVSFNFKAHGGELFGTLTGKNVPDEGGGSEESQFKRHLSIILDGLVMSAPTINSKITHSGQITGDFTRKEVDSLVNILRSGALPATLKPQPVSETTIGATLGEDTISAGVWAIVWAFIAVVLFMIVYYRFAGFVACVALFANLILTVGFMVMVQATFTLPGLAGLVLMLGMAVDANVLIYERLREERDRGASLNLAIRNGYERALPTIIDTHLTSIFTAIVLYAVGTDQLKGFAITLAVGLFISLFTSLYMTHVMFNFWQSRGWLRSLGMFRLLSKPNVNFMSIRNYVFVATSIVTVLGLILFLARTPNDLDIDFKGGTAFTGKLKMTEIKDVKGLRELLAEKRQERLLQVASVTQTDKEGREFEIRYKEPNGKLSQPYDVILANRPGGENALQNTREEKVAELASKLPDWSVEQIFYSKDSANQKPEDANKSRFFTVRTSEKERALVDVMLVRLFRTEVNGEWVSLLETNKLDQIDTAKLKDKGIVKFTFENPATTTFVHTVLQRQLQLQPQLVKKDSGLVEVRFETSGAGESKDNGYKEMVVTFSPPLKPEQVAPVEVALKQMKDALGQRPQPERLENFDSELAADTRMRALVAIFVSWVAIVLYLWFRFGSWTFGLAAVLCLIHDLCFTLGLVALSYYIQATPIGQWLRIDDFKIDLNGVAALLTLVGYSVSDTIVVFDRIREVRGKNPDLTPKIINDSINQTLSRTILTAGVIFLVVMVLYIWGGPGVHVFAYIMLIGVIIGTMSSIYVASPLLLILGEGQHLDTRQRRPQVTAEAPA